MNFQKAEKGTAESYKMHWNLMNDEEFGSFKVLKLKYRRGEQIIYSCSVESVPSKKLGNFKKLRKLLLNHKECML